MLKRGGKSSYNPYSTTQRVKKPEWKDRLDILPNRHSLWLKQVRQTGQMFFSFWENIFLLSLCNCSEGEAVVWYFCLFHHTRPEVLRNDHDTTGELVKVFELSNRVDVLVEVEGRACWHHPSGPAGV